MLPDNVKDAAAVIGYDEFSWDSVATNPAEGLKFVDLPLMDKILDLEALEILDIYNSDVPGNPGLCWDHFINNYRG